MGANLPVVEAFGFSRSGRRRFRFPCGHLEPEATVGDLGRWAGLDLLITPGLFAAAWPRLCAGYAADAIETPQSGMPVEDPEVILARVAATPIEATPAAGLGQEFRLVGGKLLGAALLMEDKVAHLAAFPAGGAS